MIKSSNTLIYQRLTKKNQIYFLFLFFITLIFNFVFQIQSSDRMSGLQQRGVLWKKVQGCSFGQLPQIRVQNSGPVDRYITRLCKNTKNDLSPDPVPKNHPLLLRQARG